ncbi:CpsD/CapB family tyrosine-protein kinase [Paenibacillus soyae]|uniref:non-specific protein-tyrosine kinase n=1 Tax=Paenibacillus soyae TaxID=2969249 RepID=A0A9X2MND8_9BACL|nr:CpsD/CapB family tyrosine-protein kinase [Paenibacillus soyae]MCR2803279.1 CpsD/CapB family tyrosine-protein kinase [Paenibacillus soyae]
MSRLTRKWNLITERNPGSPISEGYRMLRTNIEFATNENKPQIISFSSAQPGEGKSTTCANMAVTFAQANKRVLVIDADLRRPAQHNIFSVSNHKGLTTALLNRMEPQEVIQRTNTDKLSVLAAGPTPHNPSELLSSEEMDSLLKTLREAYDVILIDTPAIMSVTDAPIVAAQSDGVVMVIDSGKVKKEVVLKAKASLAHVQAKLIGVVLNNVNRKQMISYS